MLSQGIIICDMNIFVISPIIRSCGGWGHSINVTAPLSSYMTPLLNPTSSLQEIISYQVNWSRSSDRGSSSRSDGGLCVRIYCLAIFLKMFLAVALSAFVVVELLTVATVWDGAETEPVWTDEESDGELAEDGEGSEGLGDEDD